MSTGVFIFVLSTSSFATGGVLALTPIVTVASSHKPSSSHTSYKNESTPLNPVFGVYVATPSTGLIVTPPFNGARRTVVVDGTSVPSTS